MALPFPKVAGDDITANNYNTAVTGLKARIEAEAVRRNSGLSSSFTYTGSVPAGTAYTEYNWVIPSSVTALTINYCISGGGGTGGKGNFLYGGFPCDVGGTAGTGAAFVSKTLTSGVDFDPGDTLRIRVGRRGRRGTGYLFPAFSQTYPATDGTGWTCSTCGEDGQDTEIYNVTKAATIVKATGGRGAGGEGRIVIQWGYPPCCPAVEANLVTGVDGYFAAGAGGKADGTGGSVTTVGAGTNGSTGYGLYTYDSRTKPRTNISGLGGGYENYGFSASSGNPCDYTMAGTEAGNGFVQLGYNISFSVSLITVTGGSTDVSKAVFDNYKAAINDLNINSIALGPLNSLTVTIGSDVPVTYINALDTAITALENEVL